MKKLNNKILIIALALLVAAFLLSRVFRAPGLDSNLRKVLLAVDTAKVSEVRVKPSSHPQEEIILRRSGNQWKVSAANQESEADATLVKSMIGMLIRVEPQRLVSRKKEKWDEYNVGEKGTQVSIYEDAHLKSALVVGRSGITPSPGGGFGGVYTYLRLSGENDIFVTEGSFESGFNRPFKDWRDKALLRFRVEDVSKVTFQYPSDTGFVAERKDSLWFVARQVADGSAIEGYLSRQSVRNAVEFEDNFKATGTPDAVLQLEGKTGVLARVEGWKEDAKWVLSSSWRKGIFFSLPSPQAPDLFIGKRKWLKEAKKK